MAITGAGHRARPTSTRDAPTDPARRRHRGTQGLRDEDSSCAWWGPARSHAPGRANQSQAPDNRACTSASPGVPSLLSPATKARAGSRRTSAERSAFGRRHVWRIRHNQIDRTYETLCKGLSHEPRTNVTGRTVPSCSGSTRLRLAAATRVPLGWCLCPIARPLDTGLPVRRPWKCDCPEPVPASTTVGALGRGVESRATRPPRPVQSLAGNQDTLVDEQIEGAKAQCPNTYCSGSPSSRRAASARTAARSGSSICAPAEPGRPRTSSTMKRASCRHPTSSELSEQLAPGHASSCSRQLARPLVRHERIGELGQVSRQHLVELYSVRLIDDR